ncbi:MAG: signal peptide peptidase SppA [Duncaniella sp.]|nr:signal peptide peptidase SppA [Duncaniella sp.]
MKKFFISFLGALAGIWFSLFIAFIGLFVILGMAIASTTTTKTVKIAKSSVLKVDLSGLILDRPGTIDLRDALYHGEKDQPQGVNQIVGAIVNSASDNRIDGIVLECNGSITGVALRQAIVEALQKFKQDAPEKWIYAYGDFYEQGDYYIATAADSIFLNPVGGVQISGLATQSMFYKNLLDKLDIEVQVLKVGTYKSAVEPFILDHMSEPAREQAQLFLDNMWGSITKQIAKSRGVTPETVNEWANGVSIADPTDSFVDRHIVDATLYRHEFDDRIKNLTGKDKISDIAYVTPSEYCSDKDIYKVGNGKGAKIAVLYATGDITDNAGKGIVASKIVPEILDLAEDDDIDGLILYVNSGGGSAFASEQIWEALEQYKAITGNPFYVSMADYAASGGYYISCGADRIFAQPTTLTGSIGIFGLVPNFQKLLSDKIGVNFDVVKTNANGDFPSTMQPMTESQKAAMQRYIERGYDLFTRRCAEGRGMSQDSIKMIAEGRVWDGNEALKLGLIDQIGGLDVAIAEMAKELNVETYTVAEYPVIEVKWYDALIEASANVKTELVRSELGEYADLYETIEYVKGMSPAQARMDFIKVSL